MPREIAPPTNVASLDDLDAWLSTCGMPQAEYRGFTQGSGTYAIDHQKLNAASAKDLALALYGLFCDSRYARALWRRRPAATPGADIECRLGLLLA